MAFEAAGRGLSCAMTNSNGERRVIRSFWRRRTDESSLDAGTVPPNCSDQLFDEDPAQNRHLRLAIGLHSFYGERQPDRRPVVKSRAIGRSNRQLKQIWTDFVECGTGHNDIAINKSA